MPLRIISLDGLTTKFVVDTGADDALVEFDGNVGDRGGPFEFAIAQSVVQDPLARSTKRYSALALQCGATATSTPTPAVQPASGRAAHGVVREVRLDIAEGGAAGAIDEKAVEGIADAAARCGEPSVLGQATSGAEAGGAVVVKVPKPLKSAQSPSASTPNTSDQPGNWRQASRRKQNRRCRKRRLRNRSHYRSNRYRRN